MFQILPNDWNNNILFDDLEIFIFDKQRKNPEPCRILYEKEKKIV